MYPHATGLCGDVLLDIGIIEYGLASQLLSKVVQTTRLTEIIHNTKKPKPNKTKLKRLLRHPAKRRIGPIKQQCPGPTQASWSTAEYTLPISF